MAESHDPHALVVVRFLQPARPFGVGDLVELPRRDADGLVAQRVAEIVSVAQTVETR